MKKSSERALDRLAALGWEPCRHSGGVLAPEWVPFALSLADGVSKDGAEDRRLVVVHNWKSRGWAVIGGSANRPANRAAIYLALIKLRDIIGGEYSVYALPPGTGDAIRGAEWNVKLGFDEPKRIYLCVEDVCLSYEFAAGDPHYVESTAKLCAAPTGEAKPLPLLIGPTKRIMGALHRLSKVAGLGGRTIYVNNVMVETDGGRNVRALRVEMNPLIGMSALWVSITSMPPAGGQDEAA